VYWSLFLLRVHKFSRPEYRREQFVRWWQWWWPIIRTWWRWHLIRWHIWRTMMVMHVGIICAVDQYLFTYSMFSFGSTVFIL
jgi:hypothetical protein